MWSAGFQPSGAEPDAYHVAFNEDRAEITRHDGTLTTTLEVLVSAEDDAEVRRVSIANAGDRVREIDVTSYAELVLASQADDVAHPAFMKLFVATEYLPAQGTLLATRRRRAPAEQEIWAAHVANVDGEAVGKPEVETDRARFLGRGHGIRPPIAVIDGRPLSNTVGTVLDPVFALRRRVRVAPGATVRIAFWTVVAETREAVLDLVDKHRDTPRSNGPPRWRGPRRRCNFIISASMRAKPACSSASPVICCMQDRRCGLPPIPSCAAPADSRGSGPWAFPATCRSCCCASPTSRTSTSPANCCRRTSTGG